MPEKTSRYTLPPKQRKSNTKLEQYNRASYYSHQFKLLTLECIHWIRLSLQKGYFDGFNMVYPYLTAIIHVQDGIVTEISWDDGCLFCSSHCNRNTFDFEGFLSSGGGGSRGCYIDVETCDQIASMENPQEGPSSTTSSTSCDLLLYAVWTGTDSQGNSFQSSQHLFSSNPEDVTEYLGATLSEAAVIGDDGRGVVFTSTTPVFNETDDGTPHPPFGTNQLADMTENDVAYHSTVVSSNGKQTITLPERDYSNPYLLDDAASRSWKTTCWFLLVVMAKLL
jgi:hypothetical protein